MLQPPPSDTRRLLTERTGEVVRRVVSAAVVHAGGRLHIARAHTKQRAALTSEFPRQIFPINRLLHDLHVDLLRRRANPVRTSS